MKLETFFIKFDQVADVPEAVPKLRQLILELGVAGKLLAQEAKEESARQLLRHLIEFKAANPLAGRSGRSKYSDSDKEEQEEAYSSVNSFLSSVNSFL